MHQFLADLVIMLRSVGQCETGYEHSEQQAYCSPLPQAAQSNHPPEQHMPVGTRMTLAREVLMFSVRQPALSRAQMNTDSGDRCLDACRPRDSVM